MKYELRYEVWNRNGRCVAAFRYRDHARAFLNSHEMRVVGAELRVFDPMPVRAAGRSVSGGET
jgi:hypothetical protein